MPGWASGLCPPGHVLDHGLDQAREARVITVAVGVLVQLEHPAQGEPPGRIAQVEVLGRSGEVAQLEAVLDPLLAAPQLLGDLLDGVAPTGAQLHQPARVLHRVQVAPLKVFQDGGLERRVLGQVVTHDGRDGASFEHVPGGAQAALAGHEQVGGRALPGVEVRTHGDRLHEPMRLDRRG